MTYIIVLMLVSGAIAYVGDAIGTAVGKKRLSVFGLRPRWTALVVAVATGFLITLFTLTVSAVLSEDVRIALFSLETVGPYGPWDCETGTKAPGPVARSCRCLKSNKS